MMRVAKTGFLLASSVAAAVLLPLLADAAFRGPHEEYKQPVGPEDLETDEQRVGANYTSEATGIIFSVLLLFVLLFRIPSVQG